MGWSSGKGNSRTADIVARGFLLAKNIIGLQAISLGL